MMITNLTSKNLCLTLLASAVMVAAPIQAATIYTADYTDTATTGIGDFGWDWAYSTSGTDGDETVAGVSGNSGVNRAPTDFNGYIGYYFAAGDTARPNPVFTYADNAHTGDFTAYAYTDITSVKFDLKNTLADTDMRLALKVDNAWFISNTAYNSSPADTLTAFNIDPFADTTWNTLNFTLDSSLTIGSSVTLPSTGTIQGIGFYDPAVGGTSRMTRLYNVSVDAIPEPSTALLGSLGLLLLFRRRRH